MSAGSPQAELDRRLTLPVDRLRGVGPQLAEKLRRLRISTCRDLILHLPLRYQDRTRCLALADLRPGMEVLTAGRVVGNEVIPGRRPRLQVLLEDGSGRLGLLFFRFPPGLAARLPVGSSWTCFGEVRGGPGGMEMIHPELNAGLPSSAQPSLTPVYPTTEGLHSNRLRSLVQQAVALVAPCLEPAEADALCQIGWGLRQALETVHAPPPGTDPETLRSGSHPAMRRLAFEELLAHHLSLRTLRQALQQQVQAPVFPEEARLLRRLLAGLPFRLTDAQQRVDGEIAADLARARPMLRLVQGDVGSGKTVVAALAAARAIDAGWQVALMAPTELLAEQHQRAFRSWFEPCAVTVAWLSGKLTGAERKRALATIADGSAQLVVGTHALFQTAVRFSRLGLVVVDEQHRFGVHQRLALQDKGPGEAVAASGQAALLQPHQLVMTATPIPRTLAMTAYADLDVSVIDALPPGRQPIQTVVMAESRRDEVLAAVARACEEGRRAYWVCTLIDESETLQAQTASDTAEQLMQSLPQLRIGLVHGRMKPAEKEQVMAAFAAGDLQLLVATTVIEVGVDVPEASLMIIDNAERLGLAQLHQLRGRVGRGEVASVCVLLYRPPLSTSARQRLEVLRRSQDGFVIAQRDLEIRGPGELLGTRQTGDWGFHVCDLVRDADLLEQVQAVADRLLAEQPLAAAALARRWLGEAQRYGSV